MIVVYIWNACQIKYDYMFGVFFYSLLGWCVALIYLDLSRSHWNFIEKVSPLNIKKVWHARRKTHKQNAKLKRSDTNRCLL